MLLRKKQVLLFDLDGTLIDSAPDLAVSVNQMLLKLSMSVFSEKRIRSWVGNGAQVLTQRALSGSTQISPDLDPELASQALSIFLEHYQNNVCTHTILYPEVKSTLTTLKSQGYRLVLVTNKPEVFIDPILKILGLNDLFEITLGGDSLSKRKPDPLPLLYVAQQLSVNVDDCLMVGDSKNDILAAKAANMESIGLTYGYNYDESIANYQPEVVCDCFSQITTALQNSPILIS